MTSVSGFGCRFNMAVLSSFERGRRKCSSKYFWIMLGTCALNSSLSSLSRVGLKHCFNRVGSSLAWLLLLAEEFLRAAF